MVDFTLIEFHVDDFTLDAKTPFADRGSILGGSTDDEDEEAELPSPSPGGSLPLIAGLILVVALAFAARKLMDRRGGDAEQTAPIID